MIPWKVQLRTEKLATVLNLNNLSLCFKRDVHIHITVLHICFEGIVLLNEAMTTHIAVAHNTDARYGS